MFCPLSGAVKRYHLMDYYMHISKLLLYIINNYISSNVPLGKCIMSYVTILWRVIPLALNLLQTYQVMFFMVYQELCLQFLLLTYRNIQKFSIWKFIFSNSNCPCLEQLLCFILLIIQSSVRNFGLQSIVIASMSSQLYIKLYFPSPSPVMKEAISIDDILKFTYSRDFLHK